MLLIAPGFGMFPVGIAYIGAMLKRAGYQVDGYVASDMNRLREKLSSQQYDVIGTGGLSSEFKSLKRISEAVRRTKATFIVGGGIITSEPELMSRALDVDYAVIGEGEETILDLMERLERGEDVSRVDGIGYFADGAFRTTRPRKPIDDLDSLPWPDYDLFGYAEFLDSRKPSDIYYYDVFDHPREYPVITSRSCPFSCTFCYHPLGQKYRQRSVESVMAELRSTIPKYRVNLVSIYDELFSYNEKRVDQYCDQFQEYARSVSWDIKWSCQMRVAGLNERMLERMRDSGCFMVSYGFESYSSRVLKSMKKGITQEQIHNAIHATMDKGISVQGNFIFGDRAETLETAFETLQFWRDHLEAGIFLAFVLPCPNSPMYQYCIKQGLIKDRLGFIRDRSFDIINMTDMPNRDFLKLKTMVFSHWNRHRIAAIPSERTETSFSVRCPHCEEMIRYNNYFVPQILDIRVFCRKCRKRFFVQDQWSKYHAQMSGVFPTFFYGMQRGLVLSRRFLVAKMPDSVRTLLKGLQ